MLAVIIALSNFNSFAQQIYTLLNFPKLMLEAFQLATTMFRSDGSEPFPLFHTTDRNVTVFLSIRELVFVFLVGLCTNIMQRCFLSIRKDYYSSIGKSLQFH